MKDNMKEILTIKAAVIAGAKKETFNPSDADKKTVRERIELFFDKDSFVELGLFTQYNFSNLEQTDDTNDGAIAGYGKIRGKSIYLFAQDHSYLRGSFSKAHADKLVSVIEMAMKNSAPVIMFLDSRGARILEGAYALNGYGEAMNAITRASGNIPILSAVFGPTLGGNGILAALSDMVICANSSAEVSMYSKNINEKYKQYAFDMMFDDEVSAILALRNLVNMLPSNNNVVPKKLDGIYGVFKKFDYNKNYDIRELLNTTFDINITELKSQSGPSIITAFSTLKGQLVGVISSDHSVKKGAVDKEAAKKTARFVRFCDSFNIPLVVFVDTEGFEKNIDIKSAAEFSYCFSEANVPMITVLIGNAIGSAYASFASKGQGADYVIAWPNATVSCLSPKAQVNITNISELKSSSTDENRAELADKYRDEWASPLVAAKSGYIDDIIAPEDTRKTLLRVIDVVINKNTNVPNKKHGNVPL